MNIIAALESLTSMAQMAQSSGSVPVGPWSVALAILIVGSQATLQSGALKPAEPVEVDDIGNSLDAAMVRMRVALEQGPY